MKQRGFTLIELMIVLAIVGIAVSIVAPVLTPYFTGVDLMEVSSIFALVLVAITAFGIILFAFRQKNIRQERAEFDTQYKKAQAIHAEMIRKRDARIAADRARTPSRNTAPVSGIVPNYTKRTPVMSQRVSNNSIGIQSRGNVTVNRRVDDSDDLLTSMILQNAMNSQRDVTMGSVRWDNDTPTITPTETYSAPEPERSSYSSSYSSPSSDDSSSRSSYSSSYSSSSSDSSYSSSSSDSSYSSSSDSSSSSSSD